MKIIATEQAADYRGAVLAATLKVSADVAGKFKDGEAIEVDKKVAEYAIEYGIAKAAKAVKDKKEGGE